MIFDDADSELLKTWTIQKLADVSDADPDVLADYVLALVKTDEPEAAARTNCVENLKDFLGDRSEAFVNDLFAALATKSYDPSKAPPKPALPTYQPPRRASFDPPQQPWNQSRKRGYHDWDRDDSQYQSNTADRPVKAARRGGRGFDRGGHHKQSQQHDLPAPPTPPPGMAAFDLHNPLASLLSMHQMYQAMGMLPEGFPALPGGNDFNSRKPAQRCRDYDKKGFCARGVNCPYEHGNNPYVVQPSDEYDPTQATLLNIQPTKTGVINTTSPQRGRGGQRGRQKQRADFSLRGPNYDRSITSIVVEQIPEDQFDEATVRSFFSEFGNIEEVTMMPYKRLAIVKYDDYDSAAAAYNSPRVVFDNRFVKVYWYKSPESLPQPNRNLHPSHGGGDDIEMQEEEPLFDPEEVAKKQEEAQRRHEEQKRKAEEARQQREAYDAQLRKIDEERKKMAEKIAKKSGKTDTSTVNGTEENEHTRGLREQLAKLEEEAKLLGIDPNAAPNTWEGPSYFPRGRGGFRARSRGRGGYQPSYRGGWGAAMRGCAVKRLDNRPKTVCVAFNEGTYEDHQESLRSWLLFNSSESATLNKHPDRPDAALIVFPERYHGENFMAAAASGAADFPLAGKVELSWHSGPALMNGHHDLDLKMSVPSSDTNEPQAHDDTQEEPRQTREDLDVAEDDDRWG